MTSKKNTFICQALLFLIVLLLLAVLKLYNLQEPKEAEAHLYKPPGSPFDTAQPIPKMKLPCDQVIDPDFHSLRPYQAAPCGDSPKALFCFNNYKITEELSTNWTPACGDAVGGFYLCDPPPGQEEIEKIYTVDGEYAKFPIMGNTEQVANSQDPGDVFSDPRKVNEYVSWYLNGTIGRGEYPPMNTIEPLISNKVVNYSGPLNKFLPLAYIDAYKITTIDEATLTGEPVDEETGQPAAGAEPLHHNQIVVCGKHLIDLGGGLEFGPVTPHPCYPTGGNNPADPDVYRLKPPESGSEYKGWGDADLSFLASFINQFGGDVWNQRKPPLPWGEDQEGNEMTQAKYWKYYNEWRGRSCLLVPLIDWFFCVDNPFITNEYADLFPYVPLANTSDKNALHMVMGVQLQVGGSIAYYDPSPDLDPDPPATSEQLDGENPDIVHNPTLFYPHTLETASLAAYLNYTFSPKEIVPEDAEPVIPIPEGGETAKDYEDNQCEIVEVRSNPGDKLFQSSKDSRIDDLSVYVDVTIEKIGCPAGPIDVWRNECGDQIRGRCDVTGCPLFGNNPCPSCGTYDPMCRSWPTCSDTVTFKIPTVPKIPYANEIREETVIGPESTFRRIFPKVIDEEDNPVRCIADIPGESGTQYVPLPDWEYTHLVSVETPTAVHNAGSGGLVGSELYFPYQGTIYEYFLRGIQTALRPKGFGNPIPQGTKCDETATECSESMIEDTYGIPYCILEGIMQNETGIGENMGNEACGNFNCCGAGVCGPAQISCGNYEGLAGGDNLDLCDVCDTAELLARELLLKLCQADGRCNAYDWSQFGDMLLSDYTNLPEEDYLTAACYHYGLANGCRPTACTQYRWGAGVDYGEAVAYYCATGQPMPDATDQNFCEECAQEDPRVQCNGTPAPNPPGPGPQPI